MYKFSLSIISLLVVSAMLPICAADERKQAPIEVIEVNKVSSIEPGAETISAQNTSLKADPFMVRLPLNVYLRGAILIGGTLGTLTVLAQKLTLTNPAEVLAYAFVTCMGLTTIDQGIKNLCGKRVCGYWTEQA